MHTFNPKTDESKSSTSYNIQIPREPASDPGSPVKDERINGVYLKDTSDVMNNLDSERQAIMNDNSLGINQKIVTLQSLHQKNQSSAYSTIQISEMNKRVEEAKKEAIETRMQEA